jgi:hypothetical protein
MEKTNYFHMFLTQVKSDVEITLDYRDSIILLHDCQSEGKYHLV